jgi:hypothetical protein
MRSILSDRARVPTRIVRLEREVHAESSPAMVGDAQEQLEMTSAFAHPRIRLPIDSVNDSRASMLIRTACTPWIVGTQQHWLCASVANGRDVLRRCRLLQTST